MEHGLKDIAFYVQNIFNTLHSCHNFPVDSRHAARGAHICETSLLKYFCIGSDKGLAVARWLAIIWTNDG